MTWFDRASLRRMFPRGQPAWLEALERIGPDLAVRHRVTTAERWRHLAAQVAAETDGLALPHMRENMRYSAARLLEVYAYRIRLAQRDNPRFRGQSAAQIAHALAGNPDLLAETVYGGRPDLGNTRPGDGAKYIGRGPLQTTGREWYDKLGRAIGVDLVGQPHRLEEPDTGWRAAFAEWDMLGCNALADRCSVDLVSRRVNGGTNGLARRRAEYHRASIIWDAREVLVAPADYLESADGNSEQRPAARSAVAASNENDDWSVDVTPRHAEEVPQPVTAAALAADGSRSMSWLQRARAGLGVTWAGVVSFLGLDSIGGARVALDEIRGIIHDNAGLLLVVALGTGTALVLLVQHYLVAAAREGRYMARR